MRILVIEDEHYAAKRIEKLISTHIPDAIILDVIDTVQHAVEWLSSHVEPQLIFMDIQLADGISFQIFEKIKVNCPIIFTTAYDEYALKAFEINSVDYLLKPIEEEAFVNSINKYNHLYEKNNINVDWSLISQTVLSANHQYKQRFLIKIGASYSYLSTKDIKLIYSEDGLTFAVNKDDKKLILDKSLDKIESTLDPNLFFRISRKHIIALESISKIHPYLNSRLKIDIHSKNTYDLVVSREKVKDFKVWMDI